MVRFNDNIYLLEGGTYTEAISTGRGVFFKEFNVSGQVKTFRVQGAFSDTSVGYVYITPSKLWNPAHPLQGKYLQQSSSKGSFNFTIENNCIEQSYVIWVLFYTPFANLESLELTSFEKNETYVSYDDEKQDYFILKQIPDPGSYYESRAYVRVIGENAGDSIEVGTAELCDMCGGLGTVLKKHTCPRCNGEKILRETFVGRGFIYNEIMDVDHAQYRAGFGKVRKPDSSGSDGNPGNDYSYTPVWWMGPGTIPSSVFEYEGFENGAVFKYSAPGRDFYSIEIVTKHITCLCGDTLITMADGEQKRLDSIQVGDLVLSKDKKPIEVTRLERGNFNNFYIKYTFEDGVIIKEVGPHRFYNKEKGYWEKLQNWNIGDHAIKIDGSEVAMSEKEIIAEEAEMFGLFTEDGSYWANGLLCGSNKANLFVLNSLNREQQRNIVLSMNKEELAKYFFEENSLGISLKASQFLSKLIKNDDSTFGKKLYVSKNGEIDVTFESDPLNFGNREDSK